MDIKKMIRGIYTAIDTTGYTSHKYYDETYAFVFEVKRVAEEVARTFAADARVVCEYVENYPSHKEYIMSVEDGITGERFAGGRIVASFCGTSENPRSAYDVCATWWKI